MRRWPGWLFLLGTLAAWLYLGSLFITTSPDDPGARALVFVTIGVAGLFTATTLAYWLGIRAFQPQYRGDFRVAIVQGLPIGIVVLLIAWLQSLRVLSLVIFALLVGLVVTFEYLLWPRDWDDD
jgi:hypothetical protein